MKEVTMKKLITLLFVLLMLVSMTGCKKKEEPATVDNSKHYTIKIIDSAAQENTIELATESEVLSAVLEEMAKVNMLKYETEKSDDGWKISSVNDVKGDDKGNWAVYLNNQLCKEGVDKVTLNNGDTVEIVYIPASAQTQPETTPMVGGWTTYEKFNDQFLGEDEKEVFAKGLEGLTGVGYEPIRVLAMQVVSGKNYAFLAKGTLVTAEPETDYYIITVYEDLDGNCEFKAINKIDINNLETTQERNETLLGGWTVISGGKQGTFPDSKIQASFENAVKDNKDMMFSPVQLLATQLVAGTNYLALCFAKTKDGSDADIFFVKWYEDLQGNSTFDSMEVCNLQYYITGE